MSETMRAVVRDLNATEIPTAGVASRTVHSDGRIRVVTLALASGAELTEHAASSQATISVVSGRLRLTLDGEVVDEAGPGAWVMMPPGLRHAVRADADSVLLLTLIREPED